MAASDSVWKMPVRLDEVPPEGREVALAADASVRTAVARAAGLLALPRFEARFELRRRGDDALHVAGNVSASVEQTCGVTLEPLRNEVNERVDLVFSTGLRPGAEGGDALEDRHGGAEPPEPLVDGVVDLGALAVEFLLLGVDPFPRKPGVEFTSPDADSGPSSPFAALAAWKDRGGRKD